MPIDRERVEPAPFETAAPVETSGETSESSARRRTGLAVVALAGLLLLALAVVFWLPSALEPADTPGDPVPETTEPATDATAAPATPGDASRTPAAASPFADAEAARLRSQAQDILNELLDLRDSLTRRGAEIWAADSLTAVNAAASEGDDLYRQREFDAAIDRYQSALDQARAIESRIAAELEARLQVTEEALQAGEAERAGDALALVDRIDPDLEQARQLRERLEALPEVLSQLEAAASAEREGNLEQAKAALEAAVAADSRHRRAQRELERVSEALTAQRFTDAMSAGYAALEEQRFDDARAAFRRADKLRADSGEVLAALQEVNVAETASELRQLQREAERSVEQEDWSAAVTAFESALAIDASVLFAQRGLEQARTREELDKRLQAILDDPDRLSDESVAESAAQLLDYARSVEPRGPALQAQIRTLVKQLALANTPIPVTLLSDNMTDVIVYKVARLGQFEREELTLRPGEYTAVGTRRGYRDVRETFRVSHDQRPPTVTVICSERI